MPSLPRIRKAAPALLLLPVLASCATSPVTVANNPADACAANRTGFTPPPGREEQVGQVAISTIVGAAIGAGVGAINGGQDGAGRGAIAGAGLGLAAGITWVSANAQQREQFLAQRFGPVQAFGSEVDRAQFAFDRATACRVQQVRTLRAELRARRVDRAAAEARLQEIKAWQQDDMRLATAMAERFGRAIATQTSQANEVSTGALAGTLEAERVQVARGGWNAIVRADTALRPQADGAATEGGTTIRAGQSVRVGPVENGWAQVQQGGRPAGYVRPTALIRETAPRTATASANEPVRAAPSASAREIGRVGAGQARQVVAAMPGWVVIPANNSGRGFVSASAMQGTTDDQAAGLIRATATNAEMANVFSRSVERSRELDLSLDAAS